MTEQIDRTAADAWFTTLNTMQRRSLYETFGYKPEKNATRSQIKAWWVTLDADEVVRIRRVMKNW